MASEVLASRGSEGYALALEVVASKPPAVLAALVRRLPELLNKIELCSDSALAAALHSVASLVLMEPGAIYDIVLPTLVPRLNRCRFAALFSSWLARPELRSTVPSSSWTDVLQRVIAMLWVDNDAAVMDAMFEVLARVIFIGGPASCAPIGVAVLQVLSRKYVTMRSTVALGWIDSAVAQLPDAIWTEHGPALLNGIVADLRVAAGDTQVWVEFTARLLCASWVVARVPARAVAEPSLEMVAVIKAFYGHLNATDDWLVAACVFLIKLLRATSPRADAFVAELLLDVARTHVSSRVCTETGVRATLACVAESLARDVEVPSLSAVQRVALLPWPVEDELATVSAKALPSDCWTALVGCALDLDASAALAALLGPVHSRSRLELAARALPRAPLQRDDVASVVGGALQSALRSPHDRAKAMSLIATLRDAAGAEAVAPEAVAVLRSLAVVAFSSAVAVHDSWARAYGQAGDVVLAALEWALLMDPRHATETLQGRFVDDLLTVVESFPDSSVRRQAASALADVLATSSTEAVFARQRIRRAVSMALAKLADTGHVEYASLAATAALYALYGGHGDRDAANHGSRSPSALQLARLALLRLRCSVSLVPDSACVTLDDDDVDRVLADLSLPASATLFPFLASCEGRTASLSDAAQRLWTAWHAVSALVSRRLRTRTLATPQATFAALSRMLVAFVSGEAVNGAAPMSWRQGRLLVDMVTLLERAQYCVFEGGVCVQLPSAPDAAAVQFFTTNRKACEDFFSRVRMPLVHACSHLKASSDVVMQAWRRLGELHQLQQQLQQQQQQQQQAADGRRLLAEKQHCLQLLCGAIVDADFMAAALATGAHVLDAAGQPLPWLVAMPALVAHRYEEAAMHLRRCLAGAPLEPALINFIVMLINRCYLALGSARASQGWLQDLDALSLTPEQQRGLTGTRLHALRALTAYDAGVASGAGTSIFVRTASEPVSLGQTLAQLEDSIVAHMSAGAQALDLGDLSASVSELMGPFALELSGTSAAGSGWLGAPECSAAASLLCARLLGHDGAAPLSLRERIGAPSAESPWLRCEPARIAPLTRVLRCVRFSGAVNDAAALQRRLFWDLLAGRNFSAARQYATTPERGPIVDALVSGDATASAVALWGLLGGSAPVQSKRDAAWTLAHWLCGVGGTLQPPRLNVDAVVSACGASSALQMRETVLRALVSQCDSGAAALRAFGDWSYEAGAAMWLGVAEGQTYLTLDAREGAFLQQWLDRHSPPQPQQQQSGGKRATANPHELVARAMSSERFLLYGPSLGVVSPESLGLRRQLLATFRKAAPNAAPEAPEELLQLCEMVRARALAPLVNACGLLAAYLAHDAHGDAAVALRLLWLLERVGAAKMVSFVACLAAAGHGVLGHRVWLSVLPQLAARFGHADETVRDVVRRILEAVAAVYPQPVLWSVTVAGALDDSLDAPPSSSTASVSENRARARASAAAVTRTAQALFPQLVADTTVLLEELQRATHLWEELWLKTLKRLLGDLKSALRVPLAGAADYAARVAPLGARIDSLYRRTVGSSGAGGETESSQERWFVRTYGAALGRLHQLLATSNPFEVASKNAAADEHFAAHPPTSASGRYGHPDVLLVPLEALLAELLRTWQARPAAPIALSVVSPRLAALRPAALLLPGALEPHSPDGFGDSAVRVASLGQALWVLRTKTKPKRLTFVTTDGREHQFLLKGGEDLRLDERVVQLLRHCDRLCGGVRHYGVVPIGLRAGLIEMVPDLVPLYDLVVAQRARRAALAATASASDVAAPTAPVTSSKEGGRPKKGSATAGAGSSAPSASAASGAATSPASGAKAASAEPVPPVEDFYRVLLKKLRERRDGKRWANVSARQLGAARAEWATDTELLLAVHRELVADTPADLISRELWLGSVTARDWLARVRCFTACMAGMSMVGYVVGLGDRHMDNILLDLRSGALLHIDLNVCFERGRLLKVPETVPFRFTQNLRWGMSLGPGVDVTQSAFKRQCERALRQLRLSQSTLLMMLEAFVLDPIIDAERSHRAATPSASDAPAAALATASAAKDSAVVGAGQPHAQQGWRWVRPDDRDAMAVAVLRTTWEFYAAQRQAEKARAVRGTPKAAVALQQWMREPIVLLRLVQFKSAPLQRALALLESLSESVDAPETARIVEDASTELAAHWAAMDAAQALAPADTSAMVFVAADYGGLGVAHVPSAASSSVSAAAGDRHSASLVRRIQAKLSGNDFGLQDASVEDQVAKAIAAASNEEALARMWEGWLPHV